MLSAQDKDRLLDLMDEMFEELTVEDVADVLTTQLAVTIALGSNDLADAQAFLTEIHHNISDYLQHADFNRDEDDSEEQDGEEPPAQN